MPKRIPPRTVNASATGWDGKVLTGSYVVGTAIQTVDYTQAVVHVDYTMASGETANSVELRVMFSEDLEGDGTFRQEAVGSTSAGTTTLTLREYTFVATQAAGTYDRLTIAFPVSSRFIRIDAKETGIAVTGGTVFVAVELTVN